MDFDKKVLILKNPGNGRGSSDGPFIEYPGTMESTDKNKSKIFIKNSIKTTYFNNNTKLMWYYCKIMGIAMFFYTKKEIWLLTGLLY